MIIFSHLNSGDKMKEIKLLREGIHRFLGRHLHPPTRMDRRAFLAGVGCLPVLAAWSCSNSADGPLEAKKEGSKTGPGVQPGDRRQPLPAIDTRVPGSTETATFALG